MAGLAASLPALPLTLPLPGCLLYAPPLASCQVPVQEQTEAPPAAAATEAATGSATTVDSPPPEAAVVMPPSKKSKRSADEKKAADNGDSGTEENITSRSDASRRTNVGEGARTYLLTFAVAMAAFWFTYTVRLTGL